MKIKNSRFTHRREKNTLEAPLIKVDSYKYLAQLTTRNCSKETEIKGRISIFRRANSIFKSKMPLSLRKKVYD